MFDIDFTKLLIFGIVALVAIPPKDLPRVMRQAGQFIGRMRRMASEFQTQFMDAMNEAEVADLKKELAEINDASTAEIKRLTETVKDQSGVQDVTSAVSEAKTAVGEIERQDLTVNPPAAPHELAPAQHTPGQS
ncbi:Sec-independent protein translocase protein TatB [Methylovirgula sp. 4M-Z18]|uniref:Sec-independent protein translocase protein TatB n=1 Tax=Methylovirgula sp. 4M-Z18 TaxID=2293567 RepID=UPI000E2EE842|nr:Sec-independent protein translocase protein TatB [Methylovirgula sp. 4M-Z18]RFB81034.1 twin-arginine translocase subunit TatB [Methylovirgula sp. 4M-Z18]